jgi:7-carboxy-7-deazaguanine synthase
MLNMQAPEKRTTHRDSGQQRLDIHSIFYTIQGEGPFTGTPAVFVRLAGCNLQCPKCDTDYTTGRQLMTVEQVWTAIDREYLCRLPMPDVVPRDANGSEVPIELPYAGLVVITGGEPFRQDIDELCMRLVERGCYVQIETNGTLAPTVRGIILTSEVQLDRRHGVYIVCSPKTGKVHPLIERYACCYKYVMNVENVDAEDGLPTHALHHFLNGSTRLARPSMHRQTMPVYLQPMDEQSPVRNSQHLQACVSSCMKYGYTLQLQIHKILRME